MAKFNLIVSSYQDDKLTLLITELKKRKIDFVQTQEGLTFSTKLKVLDFLQTFSEDNECYLQIEMWPKKLSHEEANEFSKIDQFVYR